MKIDREYSGDNKKVLADVVFVFAFAVLFLFLLSPVNALVIEPFRSTDDLRCVSDTGACSHIDWIMAGDNNAQYVRALFKFANTGDWCTPSAGHITSCKVGLMTKVIYDDVTAYNMSLNISLSNWSNSDTGSVNYTMVTGGNVASLVNSPWTDETFYNFTLPNSLCDSWCSDPGHNYGMLLWTPNGEGWALGGDHEILFGAVNQPEDERPILYIEYELPSSVYDINLSLMNFTAHAYFNETLMSEDRPFYIGSNISIDGVADIGEQCNFSATNISVVFVNRSVNNFSLNSASSVLNLRFEENNQSRSLDLLTFDVCRVGLKNDLNIDFNGSTILSVDKNAIPLCSIGYYHGAFDYGFNTSSGIISLKCPSCDVSDYLTVVKNWEDVLLNFQREFTKHGEVMTYNSSKSGFDLLDRPYTFSTVGFEKGNITIDCINSSENFLFDVLKNNLTIDILSIDDVAYTPGMIVEADNSSLIQLSIGGDLYSNITFYVHNQSGSIFGRGTQLFMDLTLENLTRDGIYIINVSAVDDLGRQFNKTGNFSFNDTTKPVISWYTPLLDNSSVFTVNVSKELNIALFDLNLFSYEILIFDQDNIQVYGFNLSNINVSGVNVSDSITPSTLGAWTVMAQVSDDHTSALIPDYEFTRENEGDLVFRFPELRGKEVVNEEFVSVRYLGSADVLEVTPVKWDDRYRLVYDFSHGDVIGSETVVHTFRVECSGLVVRPSDALYPAHMVCSKAKKWIDFASIDLISYKLKSCGSDCYDVIATMKPSDHIVFNSIGGLNVVKENVTFLVSTASPAASGNLYNLSYINESNWFSPSINTDSQTGILMYFFLFLIVVGLTVLVEYTKIPFLALLLCFAYLFFGILLFISVSVIFGVISIGLFVFYGFRTWSFARD